MFHKSRACSKLSCDVPNVPKFGEVPSRRSVKAGERSSLRGGKKGGKGGKRKERGRGRKKGGGKEKGGGGKEKREEKVREIQNLI